MDVEQTAGAFENGGSATYDATTGDLTLTNVTPGDKVEFTVDVTNESTVAIVYRVHTFISGELAGYLETEATFNGVTGAIKKDVSDWQAVAAQGTIDSIPMSIELPEDTPNAAQGKNATVSVTVEAVQGNGAAVMHYLSMNLFILILKLKLESPTCLSVTTNTTNTTTLIQN